MLNKSKYERKYNWFEYIREKGGLIETAIRLNRKENQTIST